MVENSFQRQQSALIHHPFYKDKKVVKIAAGASHSIIASEILN